MLKTPIVSRSQTIIILVILFGGTFFFSRLATAGIHYGDFSEVPPGVVMYTDVEESATDPADEPLFGVPNISANVLEFDPTVRFAATASGGLRDETEGTLQFGLGSEIAAVSSLAVHAGGEYSLSGDGTAATAVILRSSVAQLSVLEIDGLPVASPIVLPDLTASQSFDLSAGGDSGASWSMDLSYDLNAALTDAGVSYQYGATKIAVSLSSAVGSSSETSSAAQASIDRFVITPETTRVPEPLSIALAGNALCALVLRRRRFV